MKQILIFLFALTIVCRAQTNINVVYSFVNGLGQTQTVRQISFTPLNVNSLGNAIVTSNEVFRVATGTTYTNSMISGIAYRVKYFAAAYPPTPIVIFTNYFPTTIAANTTVNATDYVNFGFAFGTFNYGFKAGTNVSFTTNGTQISISSASGSSGTPVAAGYGLTSATSGGTNTLAVDGSVVITNGGNISFDLVGGNQTNSGTIQASTINGGSIIGSIGGTNITGTITNNTTGNAATATSVPASGITGTISNTNLPSNVVTNGGPGSVQGLPDLTVMAPWERLVNQVRLSSNNSYIFVLGHSGISGNGAGNGSMSNGIVNSVPWYLAKLSPYCNRDSWIGTLTGITNDIDPRILNLGGFNGTGNGGVDLTGHGWANAVSNNTPFVFQTTDYANFCYVDFVTGNNIGTNYIYVNGILSVTTNVFSAGNYYTKLVKVNLPYSNTNQISVVFSNASASYISILNGMIFGVSNCPSSGGVGAISIVNCGYSGQQLAQITSETQGGYGPFIANQLGNTNCGLIFECLLNDANAGLSLSLCSTYLAAFMNPLITNSVATAIVRDMPHGTVGGPAYPDIISTNGYIPIMQAYCATSGTAFFNPEQYWGSSVLAGMRYDSLHLNAIGYAALAEFINQGLRLPSFKANTSGDVLVGTFSGNGGGLTNQSFYYMAIKAAIGSRAYATANYFPDGSDCSAGEVNTNRSYSSFGFEGQPVAASLEFGSSVQALGVATNFDLWCSVSGTNYGPLMQLQGNASNLALTNNIAITLPYITSNSLGCWQFSNVNATANYSASWFKLKLRVIK